MSSFNIKSPNSRFDLIANRIKYGTDGGINVDAGALYVNGINGRVGINTTSPQANFDVSGTIRTNANITSTGLMDISGYYEINGVPINNSFYPALSNATAEKAVSRWSQGNVTSQSNFQQIAWSPELGQLVMVRQGTGFILSSSDGGINWINRKTTSVTYQGVVWCRDLSGVGLFIATNDSNFVSTSTDASGWNDISTPASFYGRAAYSPTLRRVVVLASGSGIIYSNDGVNWTPVSLPGKNNFYGIAWSSELGLFAAVSSIVGSNRNPICVSRDGINWNFYSPVNNPDFLGMDQTSIAWSPELGIFCAVSDQSAGLKQILISSDGVNWTYYTSAVSNLPYRNLSWSPQLRVFLGGNNAGGGVSYSYDGINWFTRNLGFNTAKAGIWVPEYGYFLVAGQNTFAWRSLPVPTSFNVFDSSFNNINQLGLWNFQSFGRGIPVRKTTDFTVQPGENWIICNGAATITVTLPAAASWTGEEIMIKTLQAQLVNSASSNIVPLAGGAAGTAILTNTIGKWATLVSDGSNWVITDAN